MSTNPSPCVVYWLLMLHEQARKQCPLHNEMNHSDTNKRGRNWHHGRRWGIPLTSLKYPRFGRDKNCRYWPSPTRQIGPAQPGHRCIAREPANAARLAAHTHNAWSPRPRPRLAHEPPPVMQPGAAGDGPVPRRPAPLLLSAPPRPSVPEQR